jgi:hypothetical protein
MARVQLLLVFRGAGNTTLFDTTFGAVFSLGYCSFAQVSEAMLFLGDFNPGFSFPAGISLLFMDELYCTRVTALCLLEI